MPTRIVKRQRVAKLTPVSIEKIRVNEDKITPDEIPYKESEEVVQEIHCHECNTWVTFKLDISLNGNHVLHCPTCNHEHCRVVKDGEITDVRWASRNGATFVVSTASIISTSYTSGFTSLSASTSTTGSYNLYNSWLQSTAGNVSDIIMDSRSDKDLIQEPEIHHFIGQRLKQLI